MSALFKRNDKTTIAELEEYYANQKKHRSGMAWFMALLSLLITVAIIIGLFFGGRWLYRTIFDNDNSTSTSDTTASDDVDLPNFDSDEIGSDRGVSFEEGSSNNPDDLVVSENGSTSSNSGTVSDEAASTSESNSDRVATSSDSSSENTSTTESDAAVAGESTEIPNTGAGETVLISLLAVIALGYLGSRKFYLNK